MLPALLLTSCHDAGDDLPDVNITIEFDNVVVKDPIIYVVKNTPLRIKSVSCTGNGSKALVTSVAYYWDFLKVGWSPIAPFSATFGEQYTQLGNHILGVSMEIAQEGKALGFSVIRYNVKAVDSVDDIPGDELPGPARITYMDSPGNNTDL